MNERIKELVKRARIYPYMELDDFRRYNVVDCDFEKFAELIVKECAEVADNADATRQKWEGIGKYVREHFGIEK